MRPKLIVKQNSAGRWFVQLRAANGFVMAQGVRDYPYKSEAIRARAEFMTAAHDPLYVTEDDPKP